MLEDIKKKLISRDEEERRAAVENLQAVKDREVMDLLVAALGDSSWRVRKTAEEGLEAYLGDEQLVVALIGALRSEENAGMRNSAAEVLIKAGKHAVPFLIKILKDPDRDIRKFAADILKEIGDRTAVSSLIDALRDPDNNVSSAAAEALGKIGGEDVVNSLVPILSEDDLWLRFSALEAMGRIGKGLPVEPIIRLLPEKLLTKAALDALGKTCDPRVIPYMIEHIADKRKGVREAAVTGFFNIYKSLTVDERPKIHEEIRVKADPGLLAGLLDSPSKELHKGIVLLFGIIGRDIELLNLASDKDLQIAVTDAFVNMGKKGLKTLEKAFSGSDDRMRAYICEALGVMGDKDGLNTLIKALSDSYGHTRQAAAVSLGKLNSADAIPVLIPLLADEYEDVEEAAVKALIRLGKDFHEQAIRGLRTGMADRYPRLRRNVAAILGEIGGIDALPFVVAALKDDDRDVRKAAASALGNLMLEEGIEHLALALADEDEQVRLAAVHALSKFSNSEAVRLLTLAADDEDIWVRVAALKGLSKFDSSDASDTVASKVTDDVGVVAITAINAIFAMKGKDAAPFLKKGLQHPDPDAVRAAERLLNKVTK